MNRLDFPSYSPEIAPAAGFGDRRLDQSNLRSGRATSGGECQLFFTPQHQEPNYVYPLLVWLHGDGDSEEQLTSAMRRISLRNYVAVATRGTLGVPRRDGSGHGFRWVQTLDDVALAEQRIFSAID